VPSVWCVLQASERLLVSPVRCGREELLPHLSHKTAELQEVPEDEAGAYYLGNLRVQVRIGCAAGRCLRGAQPYALWGGQGGTDLGVGCALPKATYLVYQTRIIAFVPASGPSCRYLRRFRSSTRLPMPSNSMLAGSGTGVTVKSPAMRAPVMS